MDIFWVLISTCGILPFIFESKKKSKHDKFDSSTFEFVAPETQVWEMLRQVSFHHKIHEVLKITQHISTLANKQECITRIFLNAACIYPFPSLLNHPMNNQQVLGKSSFFFDTRGLLAVATLGKLTRLVFEKPGNITWVKEFNQVNFSQQPDSI